MCMGKFIRLPMTVASMRLACSGLRLRSSSSRSTTSRISAILVWSAALSARKRSDALVSSMSSSPFIRWETSVLPYLLPLSMIGSVPRDACSSDEKNVRSSCDKACTPG